MNQWDTRFLDLAAHIASWSRDPSTQCGAVIVRPDKTVASIGFNGLPRGVADTDERLHNREVKLGMVVHSEVNAILHARESLAGYTLYVHPFHPCSNCAAAIIQSGSTRVVTLATPEDKAARWAANFALSAEMFAEAGVAVDIL